VAVRESEHGASGGDGHIDKVQSPLVYVGRRFAAGTPVSVDLPIRALLMDLGARQAFVVAVVELFQERGDRRVGEACDPGGAASADERAGVDGGKAEARQARPQRGSLLLAAGSERKVGASGMAAVEAPLGLAMAGEIEGDVQAGLPIISGRPERRERLALSITAPARTRWPGRTQTRPTAARPPAPLRPSLTA
jgi:hypothetical protein